MDELMTRGISFASVARARLFRAFVGGALEAQGTEVDVAPVHATGSTSARFAEDATPVPDIKIMDYPGMFMVARPAVPQARMFAALSAVEATAEAVGAPVPVLVTDRRRADDTVDAVVVMSISGFAQLLASRAKEDSGLASHAISSQSGTVATPGET
ncbi:hypothetical protein [Microbacterium sp. P02]|uniref:hypothetical protein n=1 Tax=Microbacterium sp. P02 TaxID=3366260 RepID=UPI0036710DDB